MTEYDTVNIRNLITQTVIFDVLDPCSTAKLTAPVTAVSASYDEGGSSIDVEWSGFESSIKDCRVEVTEFSVSSSGVEPSYNEDRDRRKAKIEVPELTETTEFIVLVTESLYAINVETDEEEIVESLTKF